jgi:mannan endo-1,6-alpha-mannosidase
MQLKTNAGSKWKAAVDGLLNRTFSTFFPSKYGGNVMSETACETLHTCDRNQICFKGFLAAWLATTSQLVPYTQGEIIPKLQYSAVAAGKQCTGLEDHAHCGVQWFNSTWDGSSGIEQQMAVLSLFANNLVAFSERQSGSNTGGGSSNYTSPKQPAPITAGTGGNSTSDPSAGSSNTENTDPNAGLLNIGTADRAGAGIITAAFVSSWLGMLIWLAHGATEG